MYWSPNKVSNSIPEVIFSIRKVMDIIYKLGANKKRKVISETRMRTNDSGNQYFFKLILPTLCRWKVNDKMILLLKILIF